MRGLLTGVGLGVGLGVGMAALGHAAAADGWFAGLRASGAVRLGAVGWLEAAVGATESNGEAVALSPGGGAGYVGGCRTADSGQAGSQGCQGVAGFALNTNAQAVQSAYAGYWEARRSAGAGTTQAGEHDVVNLGDTVAVTPYRATVAGLTAAEWLSCGRTDVAGSRPCSAAAGIVNNGAAFRAGLVVQDGAIAVQDGLAVAVDLPRGAGVVWREPGTGSIAAQLRSDVTGPGGGGQVVYADDGVHVQTPRGQDVAVFGVAGTVLAGPLRLPAVAFARLPPAGAAGRQAWCTDCINGARHEKPGEGTGALVVDDGVEWLAVPTVAAAR